MNRPRSPSGQFWKIEKMQRFSMVIIGCTTAVLLPRTKKWRGSVACFNLKVFFCYQILKKIINPRKIINKSKEKKTNKSTNKSSKIALLPMSCYLESTEQPTNGTRGLGIPEANGFGSGTQQSESNPLGKWRIKKIWKFADVLWEFAAGNDLGKPPKMKIQTVRSWRLWLTWPKLWVTMGCLSIPWNFSWFWCPR